MLKIFGVFLNIFIFLASVHAADKIRVAVPNPTGPFLTIPLAQKRGFLREQDLEAEIILMREIGRAHV